MPQAENLTSHPKHIPLEKRLPQTDEPDYRSLLNDAPVGIFRSTLEGRLLWANSAMAAMLGYDSPEELVVHVTDLGFQINAEPNCQAVVITARDWTNEEVQLRHKDGVLITVLLKVRKVPDAVDGIECLEGYLIDIASRSTAEREELTDCEERWRALEMAGVAMVYRNHETGMVYLSKGCKYLLGYRDDDLDNWLTVDTWHAMLHPDELDQVLASFQTDSKEQVTFSHVVHRLRCKDGTYKWIHALGAVVRRDSDGRPLRGAGVVTDISCLEDACRTSGLRSEHLVETANVSPVIWMLQEGTMLLTTPSGASLRLNTRECQFIRMLADTAPQILPRIDAVTSIYGRYDESSFHAFDVLISRLRKKIETLTDAPFPLQTLYSLGYLFTAHLTRL